MSPFITVALGLLILIVLIWAIIAWFRNEAVYAYRIKVAHKIYRANMFAILEWGGHGEMLQPLLNWSILDDVSYDEMVTKFWRPLDSFFPEEYRVNKYD